MADIDSRTGTALASSGLVGLTHLIYALHAISALAGVTGAMFIVTAFIMGWPSVIAVILNYVKRSDVAGTYLESHFRWQIRTFWFALLWAFLAVLVGITIIGLPVAWVMAVAVGLWVLYRIVRGWLALVSERPMPMPA